MISGQETYFERMKNNVYIYSLFTALVKGFFIMIILLDIDIYTYSKILSFQKFYVAKKGERRQKYMENFFMNFLMRPIFFLNGFNEAVPTT